MSQVTPELMISSFVSVALQQGNLAGVEAFLREAKARGLDWRRLYRDAVQLAPPGKWTGREPSPDDLEV